MIDPMAAVAFGVVAAGVSIWMGLWPPLGLIVWAVATVWILEATE